MPGRSRVARGGCLCASWIVVWRAVTAGNTRRVAWCRKPWAVLVSAVDRGAMARGLSCGGPSCLPKIPCGCSWDRLPTHHTRATGKTTCGPTSRPRSLFLATITRRTDHQADAGASDPTPPKTLGFADQDLCAPGRARSASAWPPRRGFDHIRNTRKTAWRSAYPRTGISSNSI
jgi:hypothetical protein